jgi:hypothetical protein
LRHRFDILVAYEHEQAAHHLLFAAPTPPGLATFEQLSPEEKRELLAAEVEKGLEGTPRKVLAEEIVAAVHARLADA